MFESRTGYQLFTVKLTPADKVIDPVRFERQPDIMMRKVNTTDDGPVLYIRYGMTTQHWITYIHTSYTHTAPTKLDLLRSG